MQGRKCLRRSPTCQPRATPWVSESPLQESPGGVVQHDSPWRIERRTRAERRNQPRICTDRKKTWNARRLKSTIRPPTLTGKAANGLGGTPCRTVPCGAWGFIGTVTPGRRFAAPARRSDGLTCYCLFEAEFVRGLLSFAAFSHFLGFVRIDVRQALDRRGQLGNFPEVPRVRPEKHHSGTRGNTTAATAAFTLSTPTHRIT